MIKLDQRLREVPQDFAYSRHNTPNPACYLSDTDILRASESQHSVQGSRGEGDLGHLGQIGARPKGIVNPTRL